jgi:hypothetical protein
MLNQPRSLNRAVALGLAACAIAPATAGAVPIIEGQGVGAGSGPAVKAKDVSQMILPAPDQVDRVKPPAVSSTAPVWPTGPQPLATQHAPLNAAPKAAPSNDDGPDTGIWVALGGAALIAAGGIGFAGRKRLQVIRKRQLA